MGESPTPSGAELGAKATGSDMFSVGSAAEHELTDSSARGHISHSAIREDSATFDWLAEFEAAR